MWHKGCAFQGNQMCHAKEPYHHLRGLGYTCSLNVYMYAFMSVVSLMHVKILK